RRAAAGVHGPRGDARRRARRLPLAVDRRRAPPAGSAPAARTLFRDLRLLRPLRRDQDPPHRPGAGVLTRPADRLRREPAFAGRDLEPSVVHEPAKAAVCQEVRGAVYTLSLSVRVAGEPGAADPAGGASLP